MELPSLSRLVLLPMPVIRKARLQIFSAGFMRPCAGHLVGSRGRYATNAILFRCGRATLETCPGCALGGASCRSDRLVVLGNDRQAGLPGHGFRSLLPRGPRGPAKSHSVY